MDDQPQPAGRRIDNRELERIVVRLFKDRQCSICGGNDFSAVIAEDEGVATGLQYFRAETGDVVGYLPLVPLVCNGCGKVDLYDEAWILRRWRELTDG